MDQSFTPFLSSKQTTSSAIYTHPDDVAADPQLTTQEKRALLASWVSDARAVENAPALRRLDSGAIVEVDAILRVLRALDEPSPAERRVPQLRSRRQSVVSKWLSRVGPRHRSRDNDDDPPPAPAGLAVPFYPVFLKAEAA